MVKAVDMVKVIGMLQVMTQMYDMLKAICTIQATNRVQEFHVIIFREKYNNFSIQSIPNKLLS